MRVLERFAELVAPAECLRCGGEGSLVCSQCLPQLVVTKRPTCYACNRLTESGRTCPSCRKRTSLAGVTVASHYEGQLRDLIMETKYSHRREGARLAAKLLVPLLAADGFDLVTNVPTAAVRRRQRGFDQAQLLAQSLAAELRLAYVPLLLRLGNVQQVGSGRRERLAQMAGRFERRRELPLVRPRILLVDDVLTTGATLSECARVLRTAGARRIWGAVVAKH